jgi:hypothetical protein
LKRKLISISPALCDGFAGLRGIHVFRDMIRIAGTCESAPGRGVEHDDGEQPIERRVVGERRSARYNKTKLPLCTNTCRRGSPCCPLVKYHVGMFEVSLAFLIWMQKS